MDDQYTYYTPEQNPNMDSNMTTPEQAGRQQEYQQEHQQEHQQEFRQDYQYSNIPPVPPVQKPRRKTPKAVKAIALGLVFGLSAGLMFQTTNRVTDYILGSSKTESSSSKKADQTQLTTSSAAGNASNSDVANIAANAMPSVVSITNMSVQEVRSFFGGTQQYESESAGSGILIGQNDDELLVLTNNHVVENAQTLTVTFVDQESVSAQVKGTDASLDVAVVAVKTADIKDSTMDAIKIATMGDSNSLQVGETAIAIGNALGYGQSVTSGIISALDRTLEGYDGGTLIQTDAAINPGNSGGALLNAKGEVIGINVAKIAQSEVEGIGYAIPISNASDVITKLMNKETREKVSKGQQGYIGISGVDVTSETSEAYNIPAGVLIREVVKGGGADKAGLAQGTVITALDGMRIDGMETLQGELQYYKIGEKITLTVQVPSENGEYTEKDVEVTLGRASQ